ncbi:sortase [Georgenia deserti]|uniref:Sortase n=1 Tax=Georgenia deserti TaxID=2093781 RepID=A0ABW4L8E9_9MICO
MSHTHEGRPRTRLILAAFVAVVLVVAAGIAAVALRSEPAARTSAQIDRPVTTEETPFEPQGDASAQTSESEDVVVPDEVSEGQTFATMRVPSWGNEEYPISEGISDHVLDNLGLGRFPTSSMPGAEGNFALAGHRTLHSKPLYRINELEVGDEIIVTTDEGEYTYAVSEYEIVTPDQVRVIEADPHNPGGPAVGQLMTLVACHPLGSTAQRWVTYAELEDFQPA